MMRLLSLLLASLLVSTATPAFAYIGPGAGITMLGALWAVIVAVVVAVGAVLFWPVRVLLRRLRSKPAEPVVSSNAQAPDTAR
jgi:hypothetical protein